MTLTKILLFSVLFGLSVEQKDPLKDFCRRFGHQTVVVDRRIYIDGGLINYSPLESNPLNYTNTNLLYADFDVNNDGMPQEYDNLTKPASVPSVDGGILWEDKVNKMIYLYGGEYYQSSPDSFTNWAYDILNNNWTSRTPDVTQGGIQRASYGAGIAVQDIAKGFYYGGWISNQTVPTYGSNPIALSNLISYDMIKNTWTNTTGPDSIGRAEGVMLYIPASDGGMLVYFGGIQTPYGNSTWTGVPMNEIYLYDIANQKWYTQTATGDVPDERRRFCAGATWAQDQSSYNIYLYGGASMPPLTVGFDDVYILSLPSFTWIKWYPTAPGTSYPHHSLSCNVVDNAQMLVMGGTFPNSTACDVPNVYAFHNLDLGKDNPDGARWALFSPNKTIYKVPSEIIDVVGGSATGGATLQAPKDGFSDRDLTNYFQRIYTPAARSPTRLIPSATSAPTSTPTPKPTPKKSNVGVIAGAAAGGSVFLILVVALFAYIFIKRKQKSAAAGNQQNPQQPPFNMQQRPYQPAFEVTGESRRSLAELPTSSGAQSLQKSGLHYAVASVSSGPSSTTYSPPHSPPHSPPPIVRQPSYGGYEGTNPAVSPHGIPAYSNQNHYSTGHPYPPVQQSYPPMQSVYLPQPHYPPPPENAQQYPPPEHYAPSYFVQGLDVPQPSNRSQASNEIRRREVGSVSSVGSVPKPGGEAE